MPLVILDKLELAYGHWPLLDQAALVIDKGERIGLIGRNGAGKTTLIRLILGELAPQSGRIRRGTHLQVAYFDQFRNVLDDAATLRDTISPGSDYVEIAGQKKHVIGYLEEFLFPPERARAKVGALSGGERNRLLLARLFARPANLLVLDEPTNDLDIDTLELLEQLLQDYAGTVILVSHDRAFLDNVVTQAIAFEGEGRLVEIAGGYADWQRYRERRAEAEEAALHRVDRPKSIPAQAPRPSRTGLSYREGKELEAIPARIAELEAEQARLAARLSDPALYRERPGEVVTLNDRMAAIEEELLGLLTRWETLEARARG